MGRKNKKYDIFYKILPISISVIALILSSFNAFVSLDLQKESYYLQQEKLFKEELLNDPQLEIFLSNVKSFGPVNINEIFWINDRRILHLSDTEKTDIKIFSSPNNSSVIPLKLDIIINNFGKGIAENVTLNVFIAYNISYSNISNLSCKLYNFYKLVFKRDIMPGKKIILHFFPILYSEYADYNRILSYQWLSYSAFCKNTQYMVNNSWFIEPELHESDDKKADIRYIYDPYNFETDQNIISQQNLTSFFIPYKYNEAIMKRYINLPIVLKIEYKSKYGKNPYEHYEFYAISGDSDNCVFHYFGDFKFYEKDSILNYELIDTLQGIRGIFHFDTNIDQVTQCLLKMEN